MINYNKPSIKYLKSDAIKNLANLIRDKSSIRKPILSDLFMVLRNKNILIKEFSTIEVPELFIDSILIKEIKLEPGTCLTPWCNSNGLNTKLKVISPKKEKDLIINKLKFREVYVCSDCYMWYGYNPNTNVWEEVRGLLKLIDKAKNLFGQGMSRDEVTKQMRMSHYKINMLLGYILVYKMIPKETEKVYLPKSKDKNLIPYFHKIDGKYRLYPKRDYEKAKNLFGWSLIEFCYYFWSADVQEYLLFKKAPMKKGKKLEITVEQIKIKIEELINKDIDITYKELAASLKCGQNVIYRRNEYKELLLTAKDYQQQMRYMEEESLLFDHASLIFTYHDTSIPLFKRDIFKTLGRTRAYIENHFPKLLEYINVQTENLQKIHEKNLEEQLRNKIREIINMFMDEKIDLNIDAIGKKLGIKKNNSKRYANTKKIIITEISKYDFKISSFF